MLNADWVEWLKDWEQDLYEEYTDAIFEARKNLSGLKLSLELKDIDQEWEQRVEKMQLASAQDQYIHAREG